MSKIKQTFAISFNGKENYLAVGDPDSDTTEMVLEALYRETRKLARILGYKVYINNVRYHTCFIIPRVGLDSDGVTNLIKSSKQVLTDYDFVLEPIPEKDSQHISLFINKSNVFELVKQNDIEHYLVKSEIPA